VPTFAESVAAGGRQVGHSRNEPIELSPYDEAWPRRFEELRARLAQALGSNAKRIDHVGSSAVPGLIAKPIIDIQISVDDVEDEASYREAIERAGFELRWIEPHHRYFRPPPEQPRTAHVHVCSVGSQWERDHLVFRDYLRAHPETAAAYAELKLRLAGEYRTDRIGYTDAKTDFIEGVLRLAAETEKWASQTGWAPKSATGQVSLGS
jgi:GrpB-like predicted nucleotidyltransferase (UPF0157 family)